MIIAPTIRTVLLSLSLFIFIILTVNTAQANNVTFSNTNLVDGQVIIYEINGTGTTYIGTYNSSDTVALEDGSSYVFTLKPSLTTTSFLTPTGFFNFINDNKDNIFAILIMLLFAAGLAGLIIRVIS